MLPQSELDPKDAMSELASPSETSRTVAILDDFFMRIAGQYSDAREMMQHSSLVLRLIKVNTWKRRQEFINLERVNFDEIAQVIAADYPEGSDSGLQVPIQSYSVFSPDEPENGLENAYGPNDWFAIELARRLGIPVRKNTHYTYASLHKHPKWDRKELSLRNADTALDPDIKYAIYARHYGIHEVGLWVQGVAARDLLIKPHPQLPFDLPDSEVGEWFKPILESERDLL